jgi:hypothetical protein
VERGHLGSEVLVRRELVESSFLFLIFLFCL